MSYIYDRMAFISFGPQDNVKIIDFYKNNIHLHSHLMECNIVIIETRITSTDLCIISTDVTGEIHHESDLEFLNRISCAEFLRKNTLNNLLL